MLPNAGLLVCLPAYISQPRSQLTNQAAASAKKAYEARYFSRLVGGGKGPSQSLHDHYHAHNQLYHGCSRVYLCMPTATAITVTIGYRHEPRPCYIDKKGH